MAQLPKSQREWSRSLPVRPKDHLFTTATKRRKEPKFVPSYECDDFQPLNLIIGMEYSRMWHRELKEFASQRARAVQPKKITNDFEWWLKKRRTHRCFCRIAT